MSEFTPGPWKAEAVWSDDLGTRLRGADGRVVAELSIELAPDLRLIAAAPEMAELLAELLAWDDKTDQYDGVGLMPDQADDIRDLLARIRGAESGDPGPIGTVRTVSP